MYVYERCPAAMYSAHALAVLGKNPARTVRMPYALGTGSLPHIAAREKGGNNFVTLESGNRPGPAGRPSLKIGSEKGGLCSGTYPCHHASTAKIMMRHYIKNGSKTLSKSDLNIDLNQFK